LPQARAIIPEPDKVVYGQIAIGTNLVTAQQTNVTVEAQSLTGEILSSYRMGQNPNLADYYALEIGFWSTETLNPLPPPSGSNLVIYVKTYSGGLYSTNYVTNFVVGDRGYVKRVDFGTLPTNALTGFEAWAAAWGLGGSSQNLDADQDGIPNFGEYVAGTSPNDDASKFLLRIANAQTNTQVSFDALRAEGTGYEGLDRHYALERLTNLQTGNWETVPGYSDVVGANQVVVYDALNSDALWFFRGKVWLGSAGSVPPGEFRLLASQNAGQMAISFPALGPDTQGRNCYYTLERTTNLMSSAWVAVPGYSNVLGTGQTVTASVPASGTSRGFYRARLEVSNP